jgi:hypothetical protein
MSSDVIVEFSKQIGIEPGRAGINIKNLGVIFANLVEGKVRSISRNKTFWSSIPPEYNPMGASYKIVDIVDWMEDQGYLEQHKGFMDRKTGKGFNTRIVGTAKFLKAFGNTQVFKHPDAPLLVLKDSEKNLVSYKDTGNTRRMEAILRRYNRLLDATVVELDGNILGPTDKHVHRVFNQGKWCLGGRFYGAAWHTCKKESRHDIRINGESTVEPDYSALHAVLMYASKGIPMPLGDLYDLPGIPDRKYGKVAMLIMINASDRQKATGAYNTEFKGDPGKPKAAEVFDKILEKHTSMEIQKMFFSGTGLKLQYQDSKLAEAVIDTLTKEGIPCLSVHDSFVVQEKHQRRLKELMLEVFRDQWGEVDVPKVHG